MQLEYELSNHTLRTVVLDVPLVGTRPGGNFHSPSCLSWHVVVDEASLQQALPVDEASLQQALPV